MVSILNIFLDFYDCNENIYSVGQNFAPEAH